MGKKSMIDKIEAETINKLAYNPLMASLKENDKRNLFTGNSLSYFHKTGFPLFDYYFGSVVNVHNELGEIVRQEPRVGQAAGTFNMIVGNTGTGKAIPNSTMIPTPDGIRRFGDLVPGDLVFGSDGNPARVLGVYPQGPKTVWEVVCEHGRIARGSADHLWSYQVKPAGCPTYTSRVGTTLDMADYVGHRRCLIRLPKNQSVQFHHRPSVISPYLLGKCIGNKKCADQCRKFITGKLDPMTPDIRMFTGEDIGDAIDEVARILDIVDSKSDRKLDEVMFNSELIRWQFLRGIVDGCAKIGHVDRKLRQEVTVTWRLTDVKFLKRVQSLIRSLGLDAELMQCQPFEAGNYKLRLINTAGDEFINCVSPMTLSQLTDQINSTATDNGFRSSSYPADHDWIQVKTIRATDYEEEMTCIRVDRQDGLFLTEDYTVTHNTTMVVQIAANIIRPYEKGLIIHYDCEQRFDISRGENISKLPICEFAEGGRYLLQQNGISLENIQEAVVKLYAEKLRHKAELLVPTNQLDEFGREIMILPPTVMIIDSVSNIIPDNFSIDNVKELADAEKLRGNMAGARDAKSIRGFLRDIAPLIKQANIIIYAINHINSSVQINMFSGPTKQMNFLKPDESIPGGRALFFSSFNLPKLISKPSDDFTEATDGFNGHMVMFEPIKSSSNQSGNNSKGVAFDLVFSYKQGFDSLRSLILYGKEKGLIEGTKLRMKFVGDPSFTFVWKTLDEEKNEKPIWDCIKRFIIPELESHLSFVEPSSFDERSMDY